MEELHVTSSQPLATDLVMIDALRQEANLQLDPKRKAELGQFMTPTSVAEFMAGLFTTRDQVVRLLDAGAGVGSLTCAFLDRWGGADTHVTAFEIDPMMVRYLRQSLEAYEQKTSSAEIETRDFIEEAVDRVQFHGPGIFTHAILNPPYKKINNASKHRALLRTLGIETVNLYTAFLSLAIALMAKGGEIVVIIPRSFCNGLYYRPFREWMLARVSIEHIHLFESRTSAFNEDAVLQENIILKLVRGKDQHTVTVSTSSDATFHDLVSHEYRFGEIVHDGDEQRFIHIPSKPSQGTIGDVPLACCTLQEIGLQVSTGPVVDFRLKDHLRTEPEEGTVPLLYANHFVDGTLEWPRQSKKPNAIVVNNETRKWLYPNGFYTVVRRFSSKEERRRIVAYVIDPGAFAADELGFENHFNVFHDGRRGLDGDTAHGLAVYLNSTAIDECFRRFSGHTQVNATDLRLLRYPERKVLAELGQWARAGGIRLSQDEIDRKIEEVDGDRHQG